MSTRARGIEPAAVWDRPGILRRVKAYVCPYRHSQPGASDWARTREAAREDPLLQEFLDRYQDADCYLDWGDDPSFFCAEALLGDVRLAGWGVCRRDVRSRLEPGDMIVFFCAKPTPETWEYFYIGFGSVRASLVLQP